MKLRSLIEKRFDMTMLYEFILLVAVISIAALLVFQVNDDARDDIIEADRATTAVVNESVSIPTATGVSLAKSTLRDVTCGTVSCVNGTAGLVIAAGNYTQTNCLIQNKTNTGLYTTWKCSYSAEYSADTTRYNATISNDTAVAKIPQSLKLLATAIIFGAVLFVILRVIPMKPSGSSFQ